jgi:3-hydroxyisobutyrate dehydrogenase-like beta-hydroxyacid dehydrogenase
MKGDQADPGPTIGILFPGEMGAALATALSRAGLRVLTTVDDRSARTRRLCQDAGLETLPSLVDVVASSQVVVSLVPPCAAVALAADYRKSVKGLPNPPLFIDANSISPVTALEIAALLAEARLDFVDAAIYGLASQLGSRGTMFLSGPSAPRVAEWFGRAVRVQVVGAEPGKASTMKSLVAGLNKGLAALFLEMGLLACAADMLPELLESYRNFYPGLMEVVDRLVPTYPQHAGRRRQELEELERTMKSFGLTPCVVRGSRQFIAAVADARLADCHAGPEPQHWTPAEVLAALSRHHVIHERQGLQGTHASSPCSLNNLSDRPEPVSYPAS